MEHTQQGLNESRHIAGDFRRMPSSTWSAIHSQFGTVLDGYSKPSVEKTEGAAASPCCIHSASLHNESFTATLNGSEGTRLGIDISFSSDGQSWIVESVDGGLVQSWNDVNVEKQIRRGDRVVEINGVAVSNPVAVIQQCGESAVLTLRVRRSDNSQGDGLNAPLQQAINSPALSPRRTLSNMLYSPDLSLINDAVAESPMTLSETYQDVPLQSPEKSPPVSKTTPKPRRRNIFENLSFSSSGRRLYPGVQKWKMFSGNGSRKQVQHGLRVVQSKTKRAVLKTRKGIAHIHSLPTIVSTVVHSTSSENGSRGASMRKNVSGIVEYVKDQAESAQVPEKAQKSFDYIKGQASIASSIISERVSEAARKGFKLFSERNFGKAGGA